MVFLAQRLCNLLQYAVVTFDQNWYILGYSTFYVCQSYHLFPYFIVLAHYPLYFTFIKINIYVQGKQTIQRLGSYLLQKNFTSPDFYPKLRRRLCRTFLVFSLGISRQRYAVLQMLMHYSHVAKKHQFENISSFRCQQTLV